MRTNWCVLALTSVLLAALSSLQTATAQAHPRDKEIHDVDTLAWWHTTEALSGDAMEGRDTGSAAYQRAAEYVAGRFRAAGLKPAGEDGYFQSVPMHEVAVDAAGTSFTLVRQSGAQVPIEFLQQITIGAAANLPAETEGCADLSRVLREGGDAGHRGEDGGVLWDAAGGAAEWRGSVGECAGGEGGGGDQRG